MITPDMTDKAVLEELGAALARRRLEINSRQEDCAFEAGISRDTLGALEKGRSVSLISFISILRALGLREQLNTLLEATDISPVALAGHKGELRQRARPNEKREQDGGGWVWPEDNQ